ncbi:CYTH and CHAD domain-containing protein [Gordonia sp. HY285]|uniref:CYTH and CHAD domain-containing protein n=1 Tax=Gordonia liuliyuniae TaxID=2911517 RepID=UPI001F235822|nr:CYTH and CHAD domain-containing protein [Gordonia liuliyuniae]MCF8611322.1 CYTH and CHAD domain-containing protein [Gordonia liuliyuniae]
MSAHESLEIELKFDVDAGLPAPELAGLVPDGSVGAPQTYLLEATYYDTADTVLARNRTTLRRRAGGVDDGWHLKRPSTVKSARRELGVSFDDAVFDGGVPTVLRDQVASIVRLGELVPIATITTDRTMTSVFDADGRELGVFCEDLVSAESLLPGGGVERWAEWEFELVDGDGPLLARAKAYLREAGARKASSVSKLARAIGPLPAATESRAVESRSVGRKSTALDLVVFDLATHRDTLVAYDPLVREDAPDAVHQMRVAARKLRSILTSYPQVLAQGAADPVSTELKLLGGVLGDARDLEVSLATNELMLARENAPADLREALIENERIRRERAVRSMRFALSTDRYLTLLDDLDALIADPTPGLDADSPARDVAAEAIAASYRRLRRAQKTLRDFDAWSPEWGEQLHTIRKRAKAARYTAESASTLRRSSFKEIGSYAKAVQTHLGVFHDTVVNRARLAEVAEHTPLSPAAVFVLGRLDAREEARGRKAVKTYRKL